MLTNKEVYYFSAKFLSMITQFTSLYSWTNGAIMIAIFGIVCLTLIGVLINFMMGGKKNDKSDS